MSKFEKMHKRMKSKKIKKEIRKGTKNNYESSSISW